MLLIVGEELKEDEEEEKELGFMVILGGVEEEELATRRVPEPLLLSPLPAWFGSIHIKLSSSRFDEEGESMKSECGDEEGEEFQSALLL